MTILLPLCQTLLSQFLLDIRTEWYQTFVFLAMLSMITAKCNELLANWTTAMSFPLAVFRVRNNTLHLLT